MTVKIISRLVKICSLIVFTMYLKVIIFSDFIENFSEQISIILIIPKLSRRPALTIANVSRTLCADSCAALTSFAFPVGEVDEGHGRAVGLVGGLSPRLPS